jgi:competence protein ComEC
MAEGRAQGRVGGLIGTWPGAAGAAPWRLPQAGIAGPLAEKLSTWAAAELAPGRLMPWLPVAFGTGIAVYFSAEREPVWWVAAALAVAAAAYAVLMRSRAAFPIAVGCAALAMGFAVAAIKARLVEHTVLRATAYSVAVTGFVAAREERERSDRIVLRVASIEGPRLADRPERIRLTVRKGRAPAVGAFVAMKARLNPPADPLRPGAYDLPRAIGPGRGTQRRGRPGRRQARHDRQRSMRHRRRMSTPQNEEPALALCRMHPVSLSSGKYIPDRPATESSRLIPAT